MRLGNISPQYLCKRLYRIMRYNSYKLIKRRDKTLEREIGLGTVPLINNIIISEYDSNGSVDLEMFLLDYFESYLVGAFLYRLMSFILKDGTPIQGSINNTLT